MIDEVNKILCKVFRIEESEIIDGLKLVDIDGWDSLSGLLLISELEKAFGVRFDMEEVFDIGCVGDIKKILTNKLGGNNDV